MGWLWSLRWLPMWRLPVSRLLQRLWLWWLWLWRLQLRVYACDAVVLLLSHLRSPYDLRGRVGSTQPTLSIMLVAPACA